MYEDLPDVQNTKPNTEMLIQQVGVQNVEVPFMLYSKNGNYRNMLANVSMRVDLDSSIKGISMSRLLGTLKKFLDKPLKHELILEILKSIKNNLESKNVFMKFDFRLPMIKKSIATENEFPLFYKSTFHGHLLGSEFKFFQGVIVQYASYCPCSKELCKYLESKGIGALPHAQRSFADVFVEVKKDEVLWLEDIISLVEDAVKVLPYPIIKRKDEAMIAKHAMENTMFVEDAIREISKNLNSDKRIIDWTVKCKHEESIHTSEAIAIMYKGITGGFDYKFYV